MAKKSESKKGAQAETAKAAGAKEEAGKGSRKTRRTIKDKKASK